MAVTGARVHLFKIGDPPPCNPTLADDLSWYQPDWWATQWYIAVFFPAMADNIKKYEPATAARGLQSSARQAITVRSLPSSARAALAAACEMPPLRDAGADWCVEAATVES